MPTPTAIRPPQALADRDAFLAAVRAADLLTPQQRTRAAAVAPAGSARAAAEALVAAGLLTRFQADHLLAGRDGGLRVGQYVILDEIGRGPTGTVFRAKHRTMHRAVALKVLSAAITGTDAARDTFRREMRAAGRLAHPNVVTAFDAHELDGRCHVVAEFVDGTDLAEFARRRGPLPVAEACEIVRQVAAGLEHAHRQGMIHRDIKPTNLLVARPTASAPPTVKIADFGIAKLSPPVTSPAGGASADFVAPEQVNNSQAAVLIDHRADLYSLGCVFHLLLTGRPPFAGGSAEEKVRRHMWDEPRRVEGSRPDVPPAVAAIVHRLLAKYPGDRFASATELLAHLTAACLPGAAADESALDEAALGTHSELGSGSFATVADPSPWARITAEAAESTAMSLDETPLDTPRKPRPAGRRGEPVPLWMTACLLTGAVTACFLAIRVVVMLLS